MKTQSGTCMSILGGMALALILTTGPVMAVGHKPAPPVGNLGKVVVDPYGTAPLTALIELRGQKISDVRVTVHGKGPKGVAIDYPVGRKALLDYDGVPVFGLYARHDNAVTVQYRKDGKTYKDDYVIRTGSIQNRYMDNRSLGEFGEVKVVKVDPGFEDRLYLINTHTVTSQGSEFHWMTEKSKKAPVAEANPAGGALPFDIAPMTFIIDTQGEYRWWLSQDAIYDGRNLDINKRGYLLGIRQTPRGTFTAVQGQHWYEFDLLGQMIGDHKLPRGYLDATHESIETPNNTVLLRVGKRNYVRPDGQTVHTIRDQIIEVDRSGKQVDAWDLNAILDPLRDSLLSALDLGAMCMSTDLDNAGKTVKVEPDAPFGDAAGVGPGRNWAHVNSIQYDAKDDSIILSMRHQGVVKIGRDKEVKWILAPREGWNEKLSKKLLKPVGADGKAIRCSSKGVCDDDFDFTYTQHTAWLSSKGTLTVFDNGDARHFSQPAMATLKYSRFVEYRIDEKNMTVQQLWEYGKERGYDGFSPITSVVEYQADRDTMFGFGGSVGLFEPGTPTIGRVNEIDYKTKAVKVEIDVLSDKNNSPHYRAVLVRPQTLFP